MQTFSSSPVYIMCVLGRLSTLSKDFERLFLQPSVINHPRDPDESPHIQNAVIVSSTKTDLIKRVVTVRSSLRAGVYGSVRGKRRQPSIRERVTEQCRTFVFATLYNIFAMTTTMTVYTFNNVCIYCVHNNGR